MKARLALAAGLLLLVGAGWAAGWHAHLTPDGIRALVERAGWLGPILFIALFVAAELMHLPGALLVAAAAALWPAPIAFAASYTGALLAAALIFWLARTIFAGSVSARLPPWLASYEARLVSHGLQSVIALRLLLFLAPFVHWLLGASRVSFRDFAIGTAIGLLPGIVIWTLLGRAAIEHWETLQPWVLGGLAVLAALAIVRRLRARSTRAW